VSWKADVQDNEVRGALPDYVKCFFARGSLINAMVVTSQVHVHEIGNVRIILNDYDHCLFGHNFSMLPS
jgi:hypothetical protein